MRGTGRGVKEVRVEGPSEDSGVGGHEGSPWSRDGGVGVGHRP